VRPFGKKTRPPLSCLDRGAGQTVRCQATYERNLGSGDLSGRSLGRKGKKKLEAVGIATIDGGEKRLRVAVFAGGCSE